MKRTIIAIVFVLALVADAICQYRVAVTTSWTRAFDFNGVLDQPRCIAANDDFFFVSGNVGTSTTGWAVMTKFDHQGNKVWQVPADTLYQGPSSSSTGIACTPDGGVIWVIDGLLAAMPQNSFQGVMKLDANGKEVWRFPCSSWASVQEVGDTTFVVCPNITTGIVSILDSAGQVINQYTLPFAVVQPTFTVVGNNLFLVSKDWNRGQFANMSGYVAKIDWRNGEKIWSTEFLDIPAIFGTSDHVGNTYVAAGHIVAGDKTYPTMMGYLMAMVDTSGKVQWEHVLSPRKSVMANQENWPNGIVLGEKENEIVLVGTIQRGEGQNDGFYNYYAYARRADTGDSLWSLDSVYAPNTIISQFGGGVFTDGGLYLMGNTYSAVDGSIPNVGYFTSYDIITAIHTPNPVPQTFLLSQNYPNPFNPTTTIGYRIKNREYTTLSVYNVLGQKVATLVDGYEAPGGHEVTFDASRLPSGTYIYRLQAGSFSETKKMLLLK